VEERRVERRLAAILAADVAGYSRLMGADEVGTLKALKAHRKEVVDPAIAAHHGRIVKTTGDGMLVEFASVVDAVTCAVAVQGKMTERNEVTEPKITFRIGINIGDIIIDGDDIFGDGVNVAARVEGECEPGGVYLSGSAFDQVRGKTGFCLIAGPRCSAAPLAIDRLALELYMLFTIAGIATVLMSWRAVAPRISGHGEYHALLLFSVLGMAVFVSAQNLVTLFLGIELLSIPLYILCASETRREGSLESGLKYLVVGSVGSATLVEQVIGRSDISVVSNPETAFSWKPGASAVSPAATRPATSAPRRVGVDARAIHRPAA